MLLPLKIFSTKTCHMLLLHRLIPLTSPPHTPPKATTMVQHPLIKKETAVRLQPASQSAGYEEEQPNPPTLGLAVSVTVIAAPLGVSSLRTKPSEVKRGGGLWWLKCGERAGEGASALATQCVSWNPIEKTFETNKAHRAAELTSLPLHEPSSPSFFFHPLKWALKWTIVLLFQVQVSNRPLGPYLWWGFHSPGQIVFSYGYSRSALPLTSHHCTTRVGW